MNKRTVPAPPVMKDGVRHNIFDQKIFTAKIEYLSQLRQIEDGPLSDQPIRTRINNLCDSIEKDLNL